MEENYCQFCGKPIAIPGKAYHIYIPPGQECRFFCCCLYPRMPYPVFPRRAVPYYDDWSTPYRTKPYWLHRVMS